MNPPAHESQPAAAPFMRPPLPRTTPRRGVGQLMRSAEGPGTALGGVPLSSAEDAVVAAVRMGYRVAQAHIDGAARIGGRLHGAAERAVGAEPERQAVDASEKLVIKAVLAALQWLEGAAAEPGNPLRRYAQAYYKLIGAMLGLQGGGDTGKPGPAPAPAPTPAPDPAPPRPPPGRGAPGRGVDVVHDGGARRKVCVSCLHLDKPLDEDTYELVFHASSQPSAASSFKARLRSATAAAAQLRVTTAADTAPGRWSAAICAPGGEQLGWIEIEL